MSTSRRTRPRKKELFMSNVQQNSRICAYLHEGYILRPISQVQIVDPDEAVAQLADILSIHRGMRIHSSTPSKTIVSFAYHEEAVQALNLAAQHQILNIQGCPYQFVSTNEVAHVKNIPVDQRVYITLRDLPLHMWTNSIVEQILSPFCAVEYITQETRALEDLSAYTCIAWCQRTLEIPGEISVMVPQYDIGESTRAESRISSIPLYKYGVFVEKYEYLHGISRRYEYNSAPMTSTSHIVYPAQCYILPKLLDAALIQKYSSAVVITVQPDSYFATLTDFQTYLHNDLYLRVGIKLLKSETYLLYIDQIDTYTSLYSLLSIHLEKWINRGEMEIQSWTPEYGSSSDIITRAVQLKIKGLPCNLNTPTIIECMMSPFVLITTHHTVVEDTDGAFRNTITIYECTARCANYHILPESLEIKLLPPSSTSLAYVSSESEQNCPTFDVSVLMRVVPTM